MLFAKSQYEIRCTTLTLVHATARNKYRSLKRDFNLRKIKFHQINDIPFDLERHSFGASARYYAVLKRIVLIETD